MTFSEMVNTEESRITNSILITMATTDTYMGTLPSA